MQKLWLILLVFSGSVLFAQPRNSIDFNIIDSSVNPGDNFYMFSSGKWFDNNSLPDDFSRFGFFDIAESHTSKELIKLMKDYADDNPAQNIISEFFASGMDTINIDLVGVSALSDQFAIINWISDPVQLSEVLAYFQLSGINPLFEIYQPAYWDLRGTHYLYLRQTSLTLPGASYYVESRYQGIRDSLAAYIKDLFYLTYSELEDIEHYVNIIMDIERKLSLKSQSSLELSQSFHNYHLYTKKKLIKKFPNLHWNQYFPILQLDAQMAVIGQPQYFAEVNKLIAETSIDDWKIYLRWRLLDSSARYLSTEYSQRYYEFQKLINGSKAPDNRDLFVMNSISDCLPLLTGHLYAQKYFSNTTLQEVSQIITNLKIAFKNRISQKNWLSANTKQKAIQKIDKLTFKIGEPEFPEFDYAKLLIIPDNFVQNIFNARKLENLRRISLCGSIVSPGEWTVSAHSTNAWYSPGRNDITLPAGYINQLFSPENDLPCNYGQFATAVAHEMTHALDDTGRLYDADGKYNKWWKKAEIKYFNRLANDLAVQYDHYIIIDSLTVNGTQTLSENIADLSGLNIALAAFLIATEIQECEVINGYSPEQRFFIAYAQKWRDILSDNLKRKYATSYYHAPPEFRTNGTVYNLDSFYESFQINHGNLFKHQSQRITIW